MPTGSDVGNTTYASIPTNTYNNKKDLRGKRKLIQVTLKQIKKKQQNTSDKT